MKKTLLGLCCFAIMTGFSDAVAQVSNPDEQVAQALVAAPADFMEGAGVKGYASDGSIVELRTGTNELVCMSDNPDKDGFQASCFHKSLEPYFARGRELDVEDTPREERYQIRWDEITAGTLERPIQSATQYIFDGTWDAAAKTAEGKTRVVIYVPGATAESTGLTANPGRGPWIMYPGSPGAHIMISSSE